MTKNPETTEIEQTTIIKKKPVGLDEDWSYQKTKNLSFFVRSKFKIGRQSFFPYYKWILPSYLSHCVRQERIKKSN